MYKWKWCNCYSVITNAFVLFYVIILIWMTKIALKEGLWELIFIVPFFLAFFEVYRFVLQNKIDFYIHRVALLLASLCVFAPGYKITTLVFSGDAPLAQSIRLGVVAVVSAVIVFVFTAITISRKRPSTDSSAMVIFSILCITLLAMAVPGWRLYVLLAWSLILTAYTILRSRRTDFEVVGAMPCIMFVGMFCFWFLLLLSFGLARS